MLEAIGQWVSAKPGPHARVRLFCLPHAGGWSAMYQPWGRALSPRVEVCPIELPGRGRRRAEATYARISPLVRDLGTALVPLLNRPFALFGHSMGGLLAFELARWLRREGYPAPTHLFVSACAAPQLPRERRALSALPTDELLRELDSLNGMSREVLENHELLELLLPTIRADFALCESYDFEPAPPLSCPISALGGASDPLVSREKLEQWRNHTTGRFVARMFGGDHFYLQNGERALLDVIERELLFSRFQAH